MSYKISVLVPAHNEEKMISGAIESLLKTRYPKKEIIIGVDNGSDNTFLIAEKYRKKYPKKIKVVRSKKRLGVTGIFNLMLKKATGSIVVKFDADMRIGNERAFYNLAEYFKDENVGGVFFCGDRGFSSYREIFKYVKDPVLREKIRTEREKSLTARGENLISRLVTEFKRSKLPLSGIPRFPIDCHCFRRIIIKKLDPNIIHDDAIFAFKVLESGFSLRWCPDFVVIHLGHPSFTSQLYRQKVRGVVGWQNITEKYNLDLRKYYFELLSLFFKKISKYEIKDIFAFFVWVFIFSLSSLSSIFIKKRKPTNVWKPSKRL